MKKVLLSLALFAGVTSLFVSCKKKELAESYGYEVLVVWESDYKKDPEQMINRCIKYLNSQ
jgi:hypothetical protein